jgi:hypothetical protein
MGSRRRAPLLSGVEEALGLEALEAAGIEE